MIEIQKSYKQIKTVCDRPPPALGPFARAQSGNFETAGAKDRNVGSGASAMVMHKLGEYAKI